MPLGWFRHVAPWGVAFLVVGLVGPSWPAAALAAPPSTPATIPAATTTPAAPATTTPAAPATTTPATTPAPPAATTAPATTTPATTTPVTTPAPPAATTAASGGVSALALLGRAVALTSASRDPGVVQERLAAVVARLDADSVHAAQATVAAARARRAEGAASAAASAAARDYRILSAALRAATVRLYMNGPASVSTIAVRGADDLMYATDYEQTALSPQGVLAQRRLTVAVRASALAKAHREATTAAAAATRAGAALAAVGHERQQLTAQLASLTAPAASAVATEQQTLAAQAGAELTAANSLELASATGIPAPLATTDVALNWAFAELGKEYVWGGSGPNVFDCSGLTQFVWAQAGVSIPRVAEDQDAWTIPVPLAQLLPGDLVFYGTTDIHHVGIYIGGGLMINAPHTGTVVQVSSIWWSDLAGFGRVHAAGVPIPPHPLPTAAAPDTPPVVPSAGFVPSQATPPPGSDALGSTVPDRSGVPAGSGFDGAPVVGLHQPAASGGTPGPLTGSTVAAPTSGPSPTTLPPCSPEASTTTTTDPTATSTSTTATSTTTSTTTTTLAPGISTTTVSTTTSAPDQGCAPNAMTSTSPPPGS